MKYQYITVEREYGSGGTKIARETAHRCGIPCYGREILEQVAQEQGIAVSEIDRYEESVTNSFLYTLYVLGKARSGDSNLLTREGHIFLSEQTVIRRLAENGSAIFLGHCASEALKERDHVLQVFIYSDEADKHRRIVQDYQIPEDQVEATRKRFDKKRGNYYYANTAKRWNHHDQYDLVLNSGKLGLSGCVAAIQGVFQNG